MLGMLQTFLELVVAVGYLWGNLLGIHAVYGFYLISGFLMTRIINERYGYSACGFGLYLLNRFMRIYPNIGLPAKSMGTFLLTLPLLLAIVWSVARLNEVTIET